MAIATTETEPDQEVHTLDPAIMALLPRQGEWSERDYLWLTENTHRLVEWTDGYLGPLRRFPGQRRRRARRGVMVSLSKAVHFAQRWRSLAW